MNKPRKIRKYSSPAQNVIAELLAYGESPTADEYVKHARYGYHGARLADDEPGFLGGDSERDRRDRERHTSRGGRTRDYGGSG